MRKLSYVGKNDDGAIVTTTSYDEMKMWKEKGFRFSEELTEVREEYKPSDRAKKIMEILKKRVDK